MTLASLYVTICAACDARSYRVPNRLTLAALAMTLSARIVTSITNSESIIGTLVGLFFLYIAWFADFMGGADAKVLMALWLVFPDMALWVTISASVVLYWLTQRFVFRMTARLPALVPTAFGVWMYVLYRLVQP